MSDRKERSSASKSSPEPSSPDKSSPDKSGLDKSGYAVAFAQTEADQVLLQSVSQAMEAQSLSFSDLCKRSLQLFLNPLELPQSVAALQQQVLDLQMQMARLEGKEEARQRYALRKLEQQMRELGDRLDTLERKEFLEQQVRQLTDRLARLEIPEAIGSGLSDVPDSSQASSEAAAEADQATIQEIDPLLNRLGPLLEDF
jgi:predicted  nucleic acid-binding Zn-ribbon protein